MSHYAHTVALLVILLYTTHSVAQPDSISELPLFLQDDIESYLDNLSEEEEFDFIDLSEYLLELQQTPLNLNKADRQSLEDLVIISDLQINALISYREKYGQLTSIYELQAIPYFDTRTIKSILPYISIEESVANPIKTISKMMLHGRNELYVRASTILEQKKGYAIDTRTGLPKYASNPHQYYLRFKHSYESKLSYGFTLEKDPGEPFFKDINAAGFDYQSFYLMAKNVTKNISDIIIGDYSLSWGQGLVMHTGYRTGKGSFTTKIKRSGRALRPYTSVNEFAYLRGIAASLSFNKLKTTAFFSNTKRDGNLAYNDLENEYYITSLQRSGLHRTQAEIADKNAVRHTAGGLRTQWQEGNFAIAANYLFNNLSKSLDPINRAYNVFSFEGQQLHNASIDYGFTWKNIHLFGEWALNPIGAGALNTGAMIAVDKRADIALHFRNVPAQYHALQSRPFAESSVGNNERGIYIGSEIQLNPQFRISLYADHWQHPWLRFRIDAPSGGQEQFIRLTYEKRKDFQLYAQFKNEKKAINIRSDFFNEIHDRSKKNLRVHYIKKKEKIELRSRCEFVFISTPDKFSERGFLLFQDFLFKPRFKPFSFTTRISYFNTDGYNSRIYAYENDVLYRFSIPASYGHGIRFYTNLRYKIGDITIESRVARSHFFDQESIGSGNELIENNTRTNVTFQLRYIF